MTKIIFVRNVVHLLHIDVIESHQALSGLSCENVWHLFCDLHTDKRMHNLFCEESYVIFLELALILTHSSQFQIFKHKVRN